MSKGFLYILQSCINRRYYIGSTNDLEKRIIEHNLGKSKYTSLTMSFNLVFSQEFESLTIARKAEYWLKKQKDKQFIERIIKEGKLKKDFGN